MPIRSAPKSRSPTAKRHGLRKVGPGRGVPARTSPKKRSAESRKSGPSPVSSKRPVHARRATASRTGKATPAPDALTLLKKDHAFVKKLLGKLDAAQRPHVRQDLVKQVAFELLVHSQLEEEIFYPAFKQSCEEDEDLKLYFEAKEEHAVADAVLAEVQKGDPSTQRYAAKCKVLKDLVEHHIEEEERDMFPKARRLIGKSQLQALAIDIEQRRAELERNPGSVENPAQEDESVTDNEAHGFWNRIRAARQSQPE